MVLTKNKKARGYQQSQNKCGPNICTTMKKVIIINLYINIHRIRLMLTSQDNRLQCIQFSEGGGENQHQQTDK